MEKNIKPLPILPIKLQIEILEKCKESVSTYMKALKGNGKFEVKGYDSVTHKLGLCIIIWEWLYPCGLTVPPYHLIEHYIPLFTYENAAKYFNAEKDESGFWWKVKPLYDIESRVKFLDWMINKLGNNLS
jgi:hypothetical protein